jgi:hypothetical protein
MGQTEKRPVAMCDTFATHHLPADGSGTHRPGLVVPQPCPTPIAGFAIGEGHWHYAVCNIDHGRDTTALFTIRHEPSYAQVLHLLEGCEPSGAAFVAGRLWLTGRCGALRAAITAEEVDVVEVPRDLSKLDLTCQRGEMQLALGGHTEPLPARALAQASRIEALLPAPLAGPGSRAVVLGATQSTPATKSEPATKSTLVVASPTHVAGKRSVEIKRYRCSGPFLLPAD